MATVACNPADWLAKEWRAKVVWDLNVFIILYLRIASVDCSYTFITQNNVTLILLIFITLVESRIRFG